MGELHGCPEAIYVTEVPATSQLCRSMTEQAECGRGGPRACQCQCSLLHGNSGSKPEPARTTKQAQKSGGAGGGCDLDLRLHVLASGPLPRVPQVMPSSVGTLAPESACHQFWPGSASPRRAPVPGTQRTHHGQEEQRSGLAFIRPSSRVCAVRSARGDVSAPQQAGGSLKQRGPQVLGDACLQASWMWAGLSDVSS